MEEKSQSALITVTEKPESMYGKGCTDDGIYKLSIPGISFLDAFLNGIWKIKKTDKILIQVVMKHGKSSQSFLVAKSWAPPWIILIISDKESALRNLPVLFVDPDLSVDNPLIQYQVSKNLDFDIGPILEQGRDMLDGSNCFERQNVELSGGTVINLNLV